MKKNLAWVALALAVVVAVFYVATTGIKPLESAPPEDVKLDIHTIVEVDPDGVAYMRSVTRFTEPPVLVTLLRNFSEERRLWLQGEFDQATRDGLKEQPWVVGEIEVDFESEDDTVFTVNSDVTLYRYAWVEDAEEELWYSPGTVTRQEGLAQLASLMELFGQRVASIEVKSEGVAYWPAGAEITETLPLVGRYQGQAGQLSIVYDLEVYEDKATTRPIVHSKFDIMAPTVDNLLGDLRLAFDQLLERTGVEQETRNVYIRYLYPVPEPGDLAAVPRTYDKAPRRWPAVAALAVALSLIAAAYLQVRKKVLA